MNDLIWIGPALVFGLLAVRIGLPPLVGYLIADATDDAFWERAAEGKVSAISLAMPELEQNLDAVRRIQTHRVGSRHLFAVARYPEEIEALKEAGVDIAWNEYAEAGHSLATEIIAQSGGSVKKKG